MGPFEALRLAASGLVANRLRTALTMFGIMIGVAAVILLVAFGNGTSQHISQQVQAFGSNLIAVFPSNQKSGGTSQGFGTGQTLTAADVRALEEEGQTPDVSAVMPVVNGSAVLQYGNQNWQTHVSGVTQDYPSLLNFQMSAGSFFTGPEVRTSAKVVVIGQTVVDNLFGGDPNAAVGKTIKIQRQSFRVEGVLAAKGTGTFGNPDDVALIPLNAAWNYLLGGRGKHVDQIILQATGPNTVDAAKAEATQILLQRHHIANPAQADFQIESQQDLLKQVGQITGVLTIMLSAIAGISLVVAGIGIMNIMLVTVTERTREIGIRKAIGAKRGDILLQFLIESMFLAGVGGLIGILAGVGLSSLAATAAHSVGGGNIPAPVVSIPSVLVAFGVSVGIGLFFGIYPANRAAKLRPIEALRFE
jgi:putative ABC transport system permease protein